MPLKISKEKIRRGELNEREIAMVYNTLLSAISALPTTTNNFGVPKEFLKRILNEIIKEYPEKVQEKIQVFLSSQL